MSISLFQATCKQFMTTVIFSGLLFNAHIVSKHIFGLPVDCFHPHARCFHFLQCWQCLILDFAIFGSCLTNVTFIFSLPCFLLFQS
jgi:hypothetical protein